MQLGVASLPPLLLGAALVFELLAILALLLIAAASLLWHVVRVSSVALLPVFRQRVSPLLLGHVQF